MPMRRIFEGGGYDRGGGAGRRGQCASGWSTEIWVQVVQNKRKQGQEKDLIKVLKEGKRKK